VTRKLLWAIPLAFLILLLALILALPGFVASSTHRARIEALASALTGRQVHIAGKLSLGLLPAPEISASHVTITGPDRETIKARALTLDISLPALLHGRLSAQNLALQSPQIEFPWPLPGGAAAITPPDWLAALHAQIKDGQISLGAAHFSGVDADIFTGSDGAVSISGTGTLMGHALSLSLALGSVQLSGDTPVTLDAASGDASIHFAGGLNPQGALAGQLSLASPARSGTASIAADGNAVTASALQLTQGKTTLSGSATLRFSPAQIDATLDAENLDASQLPALLSEAPAVPVDLNLSASATLLPGGAVLPALQSHLSLDATGTHIHSLQATLPGSSALSARLDIAQGGDISGQAGITSPDLPDLFTGFGIAAPAGMTHGQLAASLSGSWPQLTLDHLTGAIGDDHLSGTLILGPGHATGALDFDRLDLQALLGWLGGAPGGFTADGQITAAHASFGPLPLTHFLLDGQFAGQLTVRRVSANLFGGLAAGSLALNAGGQVTSARGFVSLPSAAPLAALLPAALRPPAAVTSPRLNLALFAQGSPNALATSLVATLGDFTLTAAPVLNLSNQTASGPLTLRHPSAIAAFKIFGLDAGLPWPGPGSIALRADFTASATSYGLPDFVLSMGNLTANGRMLRSNGAISGQIDADTLAIPPLSSGITIPWPLLAGAQGSVDLAANRVLYDGTTMLGASAAHLALAPQSLSFTLTRAAFAGGNLSGSLKASLSATGPALTASFKAGQVNAAALNLPLAFPFTLPSGTLTASGNFTASGYSPKIWLATLGGTASLDAANGSLNGFGLEDIATALGSKTRAKKLRSALASGTTLFTSLALNGALDHGNCTLIAASLIGPAGTADATGSIDLFDHDLALRLSLSPQVTPPIAIGTIVLGSWDAPRQYPKLKPALAWASAGSKGQ
jgi:hypothetical protein